MCIEFKTDVIFKGLKMDEQTGKAFIDYIDNASCGFVTMPDGTKVDYSFDEYCMLLDTKDQMGDVLDAFGIKGFHWNGVNISIEQLECMIDDAESKIYGKVNINRNGNKSEDVEYTFNELRELVHALRSFINSEICWNEELNPAYKCIAEPEPVIVCWFNQKTLKENDVLCSKKSCDFCPMYTIQEAIIESGKIAMEINEKRLKENFIQYANVEEEKKEPTLVEIMEKYVIENIDDFKKGTFVTDLYGPGSFTKDLPTAFMKAFNKYHGPDSFAFDFKKAFNTNV